MGSRPPDWEKDPRLTKRAWERKHESRAHLRAEGRAYAQLYYALPDWAQVEAAAAGGDFRYFRAFGFNLLAKACNAILSEVCKPLEVKVVPVGATLDELLASETFNQLLTARFETENFADLAFRLSLDAAIWGEGFGLWEPDVDGDLRCRRLLPDETFFTADGLQCFTRTFESRRSLLAWAEVYADKEHRDAILEAIERAEPAHPEEITGVDAYSGDEEDTLAVIRAWSAPLGKGKKGKHVVQLEWQGTTIRAVDWDMRIPVFRSRYSWGHRDGEAKSLARGVAPYAVWVNALAKAYHDQLAGAKTVVEHTPDAVLEFENTSWQYAEVPRIGEFKIHSMDAAVSIEGKNALKVLDDNCLSEHGVNSGMAAGEPPPAFKSGLAIQEWRKSLLSRLSSQQAQYERLWLDSMRIAAEWYPRLYKDKSVQVKAANTGMLEYIDFKDLAVNEKEANWSFQVVSGISLTNSGKLEVFSQFQQGGTFDELDVLEAMDGPDYEAAKTEKLGPRRLIRMQIAEARDYGRLVPPIAGQDYAKAAEMASNAYAAALLKRNHKGVCIYPQRHMDLLQVLQQLYRARMPKSAPAMPPAVDAVDPALAGAPLTDPSAALPPVGGTPPLDMPPPPAGALPA
jgi:hypothetical protein